MRLVVTLAALLVATSFAGSARADSIDVGGTKRTYELFVPEGVAASAPLVVVLHGRFGSGHQVREHSGFDELAKKYKFIALYPDGLDQRWFDGRQLTLKTEKPPVGPDDVGFILKLIDSIPGVDKGKVYVAGHSNGAMMTLTLACTHAERFAGIGVVAGNLPKTACNLARPVQAIFFQGTADPLVPYDGGGIGRNGARGFVASADDTVKVFADAAKCAPGVKRAPVDKLKDDGTALIIEDRASCTVPIARVIVDKGGHGWPGRPPRFLKATQEIDATTAIADFFFAGKAP